MNKSICFTSAAYTRSRDLFFDFFLKQQLDYINPRDPAKRVIKAHSNKSGRGFKTSFPGASHVSRKNIVIPF